MSSSFFDKRLRFPPLLFTLCLYLLSLSSSSMKKIFLSSMSVALAMALIAPALAATTDVTTLSGAREYYFSQRPSRRAVRDANQTRNILKEAKQKKPVVTSAGMEALARLQRARTVRVKNNVAKPGTGTYRILNRTVPMTRVMPRSSALPVAIVQTGFPTEHPTVRSVRRSAAEQSATMLKFR